MRLVIPKSVLYKQFAEFDKIHDPSIYEVDPNDHSVIDLTWVGVCLAEKLERQKSNTIVKPEPIKISSLVMPRHNRQQLKAKIQDSHREIRQHIIATGATITPRTQAHNRKCTYNTIDEERVIRADIVAAQIRTWRSLLPTIIRQFSRIPDPRKTKSIKHKLVVLMIFGLLAFVFQLNSRREINRELTGAIINEHLKKIFPELDSIPHADTLARLLKNINPKKIEEAHVELIKELINKKKFKKLLINGCLPISIDETQKLYRNGLLHDEHWCERKVGGNSNSHEQQYVYAIEANITLSNGLAIPLMTEYLYRDNNQLVNPSGKQDSETTAFERMAERLKKYFPRLKILLCMDALYATQSVMEVIQKNQWQHMINLPKRKLPDLAKKLHKQKNTKRMIPDQAHYRQRQQEFYWKNHINYGYDGTLEIHLVACLECYDEVNKQTGEIEVHYSEHTWISSIPLNINNVHELCNLGARKKGLLEDSINTEKNRGYQYQHAFSYDWHAMQSFHYLMRLGHAINALSEFTKKLKKYIKELGCSATLKFIKDTLFSPWLSSEWYEAEQLKVPQLRLQLE